MVMAVEVVRYWAIHQTGYWVFFPVLLFGSGFLYGTNWILSTSEPLSWARSFTTLGAMSMGVVASIIINWIIGFKRSARLAARFRGNLIGCLMEDAADAAILVELALESGKSYVGFVVTSGATTSNDSDVSIIPFFSGYRCDDTRELRLTTSYRAALARAAKDKSRPTFDDFEVVLSKRQIVSARRFDLEIYLEMFSTQADRAIVGKGAGGEQP